MNTSIRKLPTLPRVMLKKYMIEVKVIDVRQAKSTVLPISAGVNPLNARNSRIRQIP